MSDYIKLQIKKLLEAVLLKLNRVEKILPYRYEQTNNGKILLAAAVHLFSKHISVEKELGCVEAVNHVHKFAFGTPIVLSSSTIDLYNQLVSSELFFKVDSPLPGDIIISPTGSGNGKISHGHTGIISEYGTILSNDSDSGLFLLKWNLSSWFDYYGRQGGFPVYYFRKL